MNLFEAYRSIFRRHPAAIAGTAVAYVALVGGYLFFLRFQTTTDRMEESQHRIMELERILGQQRELFTVTAGQSSDIAFLKPLRFEEQWVRPEAQAAVGRLLEYAEFALSRNDLEHADRFYQEAAAIQPTIGVAYYQGRLAYRRGDTSRAEAKWREAISRDRSNRYPDLRLYLGVLYYQTGREAEAKRLLGEYLGAVTRRD